MNKRKYIIYLISLAITTSSLAVSINPKGVGEVLIYPYYTVNNNFNTFYSVVNTSDQAKAIKIRFLEGENSAVVLSFNVYLAAHDVWVGNLSSFTSSISGHAGEPSVLHTTDDNSCSPYLNKSGQEFLPFMIDTNITFNNNSLQRATDGHIEVIEMGTLNGASEQATNHDSDDIPNNCYQLELAWDNVGYWSQDPTTDLDATTGGLSGTATLLNITEGISVGYDALALDGFWQGTNIQTSPGSLLPNIGNAYPQSQVLAGGAVLTTNWQTGVQAVTAVMMQQSIFNQFSTEEILNAKTEWVVSFPTKYLHVNNQISAEPPFSQIWNGVESCESLSITMWDREEINHPTSMFSSCYSVNVIEFFANRRCTWNHFRTTWFRQPDYCSYP